MKSNPWEIAYNHPNFSAYTREEIDEMTFSEIYEIYHYE